jgi:hypothetical protein
MGGKIEFNTQQVFVRIFSLARCSQCTKSLRNSPLRGTLEPIELGVWQA